MNRLILPIIVFVSLLACACKSNKAVTLEEEAVALVGPEFCADSAMAYCQAQCDFGPRTMNSKAHDECEAWIVGKFREMGLTVETQKADLKGWDGTTLHSTNIIAHYNPEASRRIIICAHWDCRPWADNDPDSTNWKKPVLAANDAASGVAVMLELARLMPKDSLLAVGVDFVCFDAEDYGIPQWSEVTTEEDTWALGAQYFAKHLTTGYQYGILLDMVGGIGSRFYQEGLSLHYAAGIVDKVWAAAHSAGYSTYFVNQQGGYITDDHKPLNEVGIPTVDIIPYFPDCEASSFGPTWHTVSDDMEHIDPEVLKAVGQTVVQVVFSE